MPLIDVGIGYEDAEKLAAPLPAADYQLQVSSWDIEVSKEKGTQQIAWEFDVVNNPNPDFNGRKLWMRTPTEGKGRIFLFRLAEACRKPWTGTQIDPDLYVGSTFGATVSEREYQGKPSNQIDAVYAL